MRILRPISALCSTTTTRRPRLLASTAHMRPAAPAPIITTSKAAALPICVGCAFQTGLIGSAADIEDARLSLADARSGVFHDDFPRLIGFRHGIDRQVP